MVRCVVVHKCNASTVPGPVMSRACGWLQVVCDTSRHAEQGSSRLSLSDTVSGVMKDDSSAAADGSAYAALVFTVSSSCPLTTSAVSHPALTNAAGGRLQVHSIHLCATTSPTMLAHTSLTGETLQHQQDPAGKAPGRCQNARLVINPAAPTSSFLPADPAGHAIRMPA